MTFGEFNKENLFYIENSQIYKNLGSGIKTVEFIPVIKKTDDIAWLAGPLAELKKRLLMVRKIWGIKVKVLNEELAERDGLICRT